MWRRFRHLNAEDRVAALLRYITRFSIWIRASLHSMLNGRSNSIGFKLLHFYRDTIVKALNLQVLFTSINGFTSTPRTLCGGEFPYLV